MLRVLLVFPIALFMLGDEPAHRMYAAGLILLAVLTDLFDGIIARKLNQVTELGKIVDPLADKIAVPATAVILAVQGKLPFWFLSVAVVRDIAIFAGGMYVRKVKGVLLQSNLAGKWAVTTVAAFILIAVLDNGTLSWLGQPLLVASTGMLILSFTLYLKRFVEIVFPRNSSA